jgi:5-methylcytosine-specific restriction endonuclease McrA
MMPLAYVQQPADKTLSDCIEKHKASKSATPWKVFRDSACGPHAVKKLQEAYGTRCVYCDHADGRTVDHVVGKKEDAATCFAWENWRACCGDCNNLKGKKRAVDPVKVDPRGYVCFDLTTGAPIAVDASATTTLVVTTLTLLDNQTLNEARRKVTAEMVDALNQFIAVGGAPSVRKVRALLDRITPHRAMLRELVLEQDPTLNPHRPVVDAALKKMPDLATWAADPR